MRFFDNSRGFSLVELLGVISIIGILATVVMFNVHAGKEKARDAKRLSDMQQVQIALRVYKDVHNRYPTNGDGDGVDDCKHNTSFLPGGCLEVLVNEGMLPILPNDPGSNEYFYNTWCMDPYGSSDQQYRLWVTGERYTDGIRYPCATAPEGYGDDPDPGCWWWDKTIGSTNCIDPS